MDVKNILELSERFKKLAQTQSAQPGDIQKALMKAGEWGGDENGNLDTNSKTADRIFAILDKFEYDGKINTSLVVDSAGNIKVQTQCSPAHKEIPKAVNAEFGPTMSNVLKKKNVKPAETVQMKWLSNVGYA